MGSDRPMDGFPTTRFLPPADPAAQFRNLKANWPLLPCAACFYLLDGGFSFDDLICTVLALLAMSYAAAYMEPQVDVLRRNGAGIHILSAASAIGIAWAKAERFLRSPRGPVPSGTLPFPEGFPVGILAAVLAAGSAAAAFLLLERFWPALRGILARTGIRPSRTERRAYLTVLAACCVLGCGFHLCTRLAYGEARPFDMIYQSDSPYLVRSFSYATLSDSENGLHQPLFGLFAAPFAGLPYFAAMLLGGSPKAVAACLVPMQAAAILSGNILLASAVGLSGRARLRYVLAASCAAPFLFFSMCPEQYALSFFWLAMLVLFLSRGEDPGSLVTMGSVGSTVLSGFLLPFLPGFREDLSMDCRFRRVRIRAARGLLGAGFLLVLSLRAGLLLDFPWMLSARLGFAGGGRDLADQARQASMMFRSALLPPPSGPDAASFPGIVRWAQLPVERVSLFGLAVLALALLGWWTCRWEAWARIAGAWLVMAVVSTFLLGYGAPENGMQLYSLYLCWPVLPLLSVHVRRTGLDGRPAGAATAMGCAMLLACSLMSFLGMLQFGMEHWPA